MTANDRTIRHIVCAFRSRPEGEKTVKRAIALALENEARLTFFQAIDAEFIARITTKQPTLKTIYRELTDMAEFAMLILCNQARLRGVEEVDYAIRRGKVRQELIRFVAEVDPDLLVMGRPRPTPGRDAFSHKELDSLVAELERAGHLRVEQVL